MTTTKYEQFVKEMCQPYTDPNYCVVALNEEAGEIAGWWKKHELRGNPGNKLSTKDLMSELGDVLFYLTRMASHYGWSLEDVMDFNRQKLNERYATNGGKILG